MATKRFRNGAWHYRIQKKGLLPNHIYVSFKDEKEGDAHVANMEALLARGIVPSQARAEPRKAARYQYLKQVIASEIAANRVSPSDATILPIIAARYPNTALSELSYRWAEDWIAEMKRVRHMSPNTIRHHVGALARCLDQLTRRGELAANPLRVLPRRYSIYSDADKEALPKGRAARVDVSRDRRVEAGEEENIRAVLAGETPEGRAKPLMLRYQAALECVFTLAIESAMRLAEIYTLERSQVDLQKRTIFLEKTKNGDKRQVPMSSPAIAAYKAYAKHVLAKTRGMEDADFADGLLFPWWDGQPAKESLNRATAKLSAQFARIFSAAGCPDLRFHDLRHEATSRFYERTNLSDVEIAKITGHKSQAMLMRYANLRGSVLAGRLW